MNASAATFRSYRWTLRTALLVPLLLAGCGNSTEAISSPSITTASANATTTIPFAARTWTWDMTTTTGYQVAYQLQGGNPAHLQDVTLLPGFTSRDDVTSACELNPSTDALVPLRLTMTNRTPNFPADLSINFNEPMSNLDTTEFYVIVHYSDGAKCTEVFPGTTSYAAFGASCKQIAPNAACTTSAYAIVKDYYTPTSPQGNDTIFKRLVMSIYNHDENAGPISNLTGPGAQMITQASMYGGTTYPVVPLAGA
jgi:hypothetical protein